VLDAVGSALQGMRSSLDQLDRTARRVAAADDPGDLPEALAGLREADWAMQANAAVVRTAGEMVGTLLDRLA
jgi:hypothetical protein